MRMTPHWHLSISDGYSTKLWTSAHSVNDSLWIVRPDHRLHEAESAACFFCSMYLRLNMTWQKSAERKADGYIWPEFSPDNLFPFEHYTCNSCNYNSHTRYKMDYMYREFDVYR